MDSVKSIRKESRARHWWIIVYPDSAPTNWRSIFEDTHVPHAISPLHDQDVDDAGEPKKPHWHVIFSFDGLKSFDQVKEIADFVCSPIPKRIESIRGAVRYLCHLDSKEKHKYSVSDVECCCGFDMTVVDVATGESKYDVLRQMARYCVENDVTEYEDLFVYAMENEPEWFKALADSCTYAMSALLKSRRHRKERADNAEN